MAVVRFHTAVDFGNYDYGSWFTAKPVTATADQMVYVNNTLNQTVTIDGHDFTYQSIGPSITFPNGGFVTDVSGVVGGEVAFTIEDVAGSGGTGASVVTIRNAAIAGDDVALANEMFGTNDVFYGSTGNDALYGFGGNDKLRGGKGADTLNGGEGVDRLYGGRGGDTFKFDSAAETTRFKSDFIMDLAGADKIDLTNMGVTSLAGITASYDAASNLTKFSIDADGNGKADAAILAVGDQTAYTIDSSHFII